MGRPTPGFHGNSVGMERDDAGILHGWKQTLSET